VNTPERADEPTIHVESWNIMPTDEQAAARMSMLRSLCCDTEEAHIEADALLCELLKNKGYPETVAAFQAMNKWYA
jgi:putative heme iron utilization protein